MDLIEKLEGQFEKLSLEDPPPRGGELEAQGGD
jgi:hypothetical protein